MRDHRSSSILLLVALGLAHSGGARAESTSEAADKLFRDGRDAMKNREYAVACPKFEESERLEPANGTLLNLALCEEALGRPADARAHLKRLLEVPALDDERRTIARQHLEALEQAAPAPTRPAPISTPAPRAEADRPHPSDSRVLTDHGDAGAEGPQPASPHVAVYVLGAVGLVSLATSVATGVLVIERGDTVAAHCPNKQCDDEGLTAAASGRTLSTVGTVTFGVGVALTALSGYFLLQPGPSPRRPKIAVTGSSHGASASIIQEF